MPFREEFGQVTGCKMKILAFKNQKWQEIYFLLAPEYSEEILSTLERRKTRGLTDQELAFKAIFIDGKMVKTSQIRRLKQILRIFDEVGISNEIFAFLEENPTLNEYEYLAFLTKDEETKKALEREISSQFVQEL